MNNKFRMFLAIIVIAIALFYKQVPVTPPIPDKLARPSVEMVEMVSGLSSIENKEDSSKLSGVFIVMSEKLKDMAIKNNLQLQYFIDFVGKDVFGAELLGKYPNFAPSAASLIEKVAGKQDDPKELTLSEKQKLAELFYAFGWKLYSSETDSFFELYKSKALISVAKYNNEPVVPPEPPVVEKCICDGKGYIVHGDGHRTKCPCIESGGNCEHNPKCGTIKAELSKEDEQRFIEIIKEYLEKNKEPEEIPPVIVAPEEVPETTAQKEETLPFPSSVSLTKKEGERKTFIEMLPILNRAK